MPQVFSVQPPAVGAYVFIEGGLFYNGSSEQMIKSFYIDPFEVTQELWLSVTDRNPSVFKNNAEGGEKQHKRSVENISWHDALVFCNLLSAAEGFEPCYIIGGSTNLAEWGKVPDEPDAHWDDVLCRWEADGYRLPTEAEWQYAARGGKNGKDYTYSGSYVTGAVAWYDGTSSGKTHQVGLKLPNTAGLFDMSGNVIDCAVCFEDSFYPHFRSMYGGLRLVRSVNRLKHTKAESILNRLPLLLQRRSCFG